MSVHSAPLQLKPFEPANVDDPRLYINREVSWIRFNERVLEEALDQRHPLLERVKFLAISASNLDEFFMIRVSALHRQLANGVLETPPDGMTASEQVAAIRQEIMTQLARQSVCWRHDLMPALQAAGIQILCYRELKPKQRALVDRYFTREIFPVLTPLAFDPAHPFPHISNLSLNLAVVIKDPKQGERFARVKVPDVFPRLVRVPDEDKVEEHEQLGLVEVLANNFVWLEDVLAANMRLMFPGLDVVDAYPFRITRDADLEIKEDEASDLLTTVEEQVDRRHFGSAVRLEVDHDMPEFIRDVLIRNVEVAPYQIYTVDGPLGLVHLMELTRIDRPDLKDTPFLPAIPELLTKPKDNLFSAIRAQDLLLYHPYDSFAPVLDFIREAARDPNVLAIKQTLYRIGANSPLVEALTEARENGKQVAVLLELKARFDEENNITWARTLEDEGVHVVYGVLGLKTHAKMCLIVRREQDGIRRYVHMSTGNYNTITARIYTDLSLFTCDPLIGADISDLFNALTGYSRKDSYAKLLVAPGTMRQQILNRIEREVQRHREHGDGYLAFKLNALVDRHCIRALYRASQAGVKIDLQVRGICCLRPGVEGVSETITVTSIVGRFLEHARIYYFRNGGQEEVFLGSADLMPRNLDSRVEILFPVQDPRLRDTIVHDILDTHLQDNVQARRLLADGRYERLKPGPRKAALNSQEWMLTRRRHRL
ncbi:MAG: polyphosphate kinase 1 [Nitrospiraceae bacterium]|nr:polyphosphate kinase 1 [Nitrospiraceae bacterium]